MITVQKVMPSIMEIAIYLEKLFQRLESVYEHPTVSYEELLYMRLTYEIAQGTRNQQVPEYFEAI